MKLCDLNTEMLAIFSKYGKMAKNRHMGYPHQWKIKIVDTSDDLGYCELRNKKIVLSKWMIENCSEYQILDTLRHEVAHALAGVELSANGRRIVHGKTWKSFARLVGAKPKATVSSAELGIKVEPKESKYKIIYCNKNGIIENVSSCNRKLKELGYREMANRPETEGNLWHVLTEDFNQYNNDHTEMMKHTFR